MSNKTKHTIILTMGIFILAIAYLSTAFYIRYINSVTYGKILACIENKDYIQAKELVDTMSIGYKDLDKLLPEIYTGIGEQKVYKLIDQGQYDEALKSIENIQDKDSREALELELHYNLGIEAYNKLNYGDALSHLVLCSDYLDSDLYYLRIVNTIKPVLLDTLYSQVQKDIQSDDIESAKNNLRVLVDYNYKDSIQLLNNLN